MAEQQTRPGSRRRKAEDTIMICWAGVSFGEILGVRCIETGEHVAHIGILATETRKGEVRAEGVRKRHVVKWYDNGNVRIWETKGD